MVEPVSAIILAKIVVGKLIAAHLGHVAAAPGAVAHTAAASGAAVKAAVATTAAAHPVAATFVHAGVTANRARRVWTIGRALTSDWRAIRS
jgi:hypothetical protein